MPHYVGLDAAKATTSICIVNEVGERVREGVVETEPRAIIAFLRGERRRYGRIGIEAMSFTPRLYEAIAKAGLPIICIENRHAHGVLKARLNKTDRNDARGIAEIMRVGIYKAVHIKTLASQEAKVLLTARKSLVHKRKDLDNVVGATLLQAGRKVGRGSADTFVRRVRAVIGGQGAIREAVELLLEVRVMLLSKIAELEAKIDALADSDAVCRRLMTAPGVGRLTALTYRCAIDVAERFSHSRDVGPHLGMTPRLKDSGTVVRHGRISRCGDSGARSALWVSARSILRSRTRPSALRSWGKEVEAHRGYWRALVAVARKLAVILHRMWVTETDFAAHPAA
jgi:transposase